jgi:hypothetical protein
MAEARSVTELSSNLERNVPRDHLTVVDTHVLRWSGVSVTPTNDGMVVFVPKPSFLIHTLMRQVFRFKTRLVTAVWPAPPLPTFGFIVGFMAKVLSDSNSWFRTGPVADLLWKFDTKYISKLPLHRLVPRSKSFFSFRNVSSHLESKPVHATDRINQHTSIICLWRVLLSNPFMPPMAPSNTHPQVVYTHGVVYCHALHATGRINQPTSSIYIYTFLF